MSSRSLIDLSASANMLWFPLVCLHFNYCSLRLWLALFYICISLLMFSMTFIHFTLISVIFMTISLNSLYGKLPISIYLFLYCYFLGFCPIFIWEVFLCLFILLNFPLVSTCCVYQPHLPVFKDLSTKYPVGPSGATLSGHSRYLDWGSPRYSRNIPCVDWVYSPVVVELQFLQVYWWVVLAPSVILLLSLMKMFIDILI